MTTTTEKISFYRECEKTVSANVFCCLTDFVSYIVKQDDFWSDGRDCPLTISDVEHKQPKTSDDETDDEPFDFYEAWAVSDWLADELYERGEWVARFKYSPCIWFRQTTGQAIYCDDVIWDITRARLVRIGICTEVEAAALNFCD